MLKGKDNIQIAIRDYFVNHYFKQDETPKITLPLGSFKKPDGIEAARMDEIPSKRNHGVPMEPFRIERGLTYGGHIASFLFNLVAESLNFVINKACEKGIIADLKIGNE